MAIDIRPLSISAMFNNIKSFFQSQENNSKWRDLSTGAEGIFCMRMLANIISVISLRVMTALREAFHDTANFMSSQIALAVNNGYSVFRGRNHRRRIRLVLNEDINRTIPALSVVGFYNSGYAIITLEEINPSKNQIEGTKTIEFMATIGSLREITWTAKTSGLKKFTRHEQGISEDYILYLDGTPVPTTKIAKEKLNDKYYVYTNPYKSVTIEYLNNLATATHKYDNDTEFTLRYVELADMDLTELTSDMFTIGTLENSVVTSSYKDFEDIESIKQNSPIYREMQNLIRSKEDWKDAYKETLPVVKEITYRALTPTYTQLCCLKSDHTLMECEYSADMTKIIDTEENSIHDILEPARYFGRPFPDMEDPKREVTTLNITLGLTTSYKFEDDIKTDVRNIIDGMYKDKFDQTVDVYDIEQELKQLTYVKYARVSFNTPKRQNLNRQRKGDMVVETLDYGTEGAIEKVYKCKDVLGMSSEVEPIWNVPPSIKNIETGYITVDKELIWQCYKRLANLDNVTPWNYSSYYAVGDFVSTETYPNYVFKCISLIARNGEQAPDVVGVEVGDYVEDGNLLLICIPYNSSDYEDRGDKSSTHKLRDRYNINGLSFEVVGFLGMTSGSTTVKVRSESQELYSIPVDARPDMPAGNLYLDSGDYRAYVKQGDLIQVSAKLSKNTPYEEMIEDGLTLSAISAAKVKEYEDEEETGGEEEPVIPVVNANTTVNIDLSNSMLSSFGLSGRTAPETKGLKVDDELNDFQLRLLCIAYDATLEARQNSKKYQITDKFNIVGVTDISFEVIRLQSAGLTGEAEPSVWNKNIGDTVEDYQLVETLIAYDASYPVRKNFSEYLVGECFNLPEISDKSLQVTGITDAGNDIQAASANPGTIEIKKEEIVTEEEPVAPEEAPEKEEQNANWKKLEKMKAKMEYVQSWITSETNDNLRTPADVIEFYKSLGDGSRFSLEELAELTEYYNEYKPEDEAQIYIHMDQFESNREVAVQELLEANQLPVKPLIDINCVKYYNENNELMYIDRYGSATLQPDGTLVFDANYEPLSTEYAIQREDANGTPVKILRISTDSEGKHVVQETYTKTYITTVTNVSYKPYSNRFINKYLTCIETTTPVGYYMEGSIVNFAYNTVLDGKILWEEVTDLEKVEYDWNVFPKIDINLDVRS